MIHLTQGSPGSGMTFSACGPLDVNSAAPAVTAPAVDGRGVHIPHAFVGPLVPHYTDGAPAGLCTGTHLDSFDDYLLHDKSFRIEDLDAPEHVSRGACYCMSFAHFSLSAHLVARAGGVS